MKNTELNDIKKSLKDSLDFTKFESFFKDDFELSTLSKTLSDLDFKKRFKDYRKKKLLSKGIVDLKDEAFISSFNPSS
jgi:hypothetical protein